MSKARSGKHRRSAPVHPFDRLHGTDTGSLIPGERLSQVHRHGKHATAYHGVAPSLFSKLLRQWQQFALHPIQRTAFLDVGAGKGRAMLLATQERFRRVVGVELDPELAAVAQQNICLWQAMYAGSPMRLEHGDALRLRLPAGPCALFLFNPFDAVVMDRLMARLLHHFQHRPDELDVLYVNDEHRDVLRHEYPFQQVWRGRIHLSHEDRTADKAIISHDADGLYVTTGYEDCSIWRLEA